MKSILGRVFCLLSLLCAGNAFANDDWNAPDQAYYKTLTEVYRTKGADPFVYDAAQQKDLPCAVRLGRFDAPDGTATHLYGIRTEKYGDDGIVAVIRNKGREEVEPIRIVWRDCFSKPEIRPAAPSGGRQGEFFIRVPLGGGTGMYVEELAAVFTGIRDDGVGIIEAARLSSEKAAELAGKLVEVVFSGSRAVFRTRNGAELFSVNADVPFLPNASDVFAYQVRYVFDAAGAAKLRIRPVLSFKQPSPEFGPALWCDREIEFNLRIATPSDNPENSFILAAPSAVSDER